MKRRRGDDAVGQEMTASPGGIEGERGRGGEGALGGWVPRRRRDVVARVRQVEAYAGWPN